MSGMSCRTSFLTKNLNVRWNILPKFLSTLISIYILDIQYPYESWEATLSWQIHKRRYLDRKGFCRAFTIWKVCMNRVFVFVSRLCSLYFQLSKYRERIQLLKQFGIRICLQAHWWFIKMRCSPRFNTKKTSSSCIFFTSLSYFSLEIPRKSLPKDVTYFKRCWISIKCESRWQTNGNISEKIHTLLLASTWNFTAAGDSLLLQRTQGPIQVGGKLNTVNISRKVVSSGESTQ